MIEGSGARSVPLLLMDPDPGCPKTYCFRQPIFPLLFLGPVPGEGEQGRGHVHGAGSGRHPPGDIRHRLRVRVCDAALGAAHPLLSSHRTGGCAG